MSKPLGFLYTGNSLDVLKTLPDESVQMCVTSPPYWGLRDYKTDPVIKAHTATLSPTRQYRKDGTKYKTTGRNSPDVVTVRRRITV